MIPKIGEYVEDHVDPPTPPPAPDCVMKVAHSHQERSDLDYAVQIASAIFRSGRDIGHEYVAIYAIECLNKIKKGLKG